MFDAVAKVFTCCFKLSTWPIKPWRVCKVFPTLFADSPSFLSASPAAWILPATLCKLEVRFWVFWVEADSTLPKIWLKAALIACFCWSFNLALSIAWA